MIALTAALVGCAIAAVVYWWGWGATLFLRGDSGTYRNALVWSGAVGGALAGAVFGTSAIPLARAVGGSAGRWFMCSLLAWIAAGIVASTLVPDCVSSPSAAPAIISVALTASTFLVAWRCRPRA